MLIVHDRQFGNDPVHMPIVRCSAIRRACAARSTHAGPEPRIPRLRRARSARGALSRAALAGCGRQDLPDHASAIARVGGLISRDQCVGPWQVPVSDVAVTLADYQQYAGEAMAIGERTPAALLDAAASARLAVAEAITNILAADIARLREVRLSAIGWRPAASRGEDAALYAAVRAVARSSVRHSASRFRSARTRCR